MSSIRADVAAMLRAGATHAQIKEQLDVTEHTVRRAREALRMTRARRTRSELTAIEDQAVAMLHAGATYKQIYDEFRLSRNRISELRKTNVIPVPDSNHVSATRRLTVDQAFTRHTQPTPAGEHLLWTGPRRGRSAKLTASGRVHNARTVAFQRHHGREPDGRLMRTCDHPQCIAGAHHTDQRLRQAQDRVDYAASAIVEGASRVT
ncbi:hypothetical protein [Streptomyces chartreusis]|uniref:hypothetical protein n=1 Tax=Streptomyces chartreusis TaxID=1969 RepID=UPI0037FBDD4D